MVSISSRVGVVQIRSHFNATPTPTLSVGLGPNKALNSLLVKISRSYDIASGVVHAFMAWLMAEMRPWTSELVRRNPIFSSKANRVMTSTVKKLIVLDKFTTGGFALDAFFRR